MPGHYIIKKSSAVQPYHFVLRAGGNNAVSYTTSPSPRDQRANSTTPKRARAQPPQLILRTHVDGRNSGVDAKASSLVLKGSYAPITEFSVTTRDYPWNTLRASSWNPIEIEGNFRRPCPEISFPVISKTIKFCCPTF